MNPSIYLYFRRRSHKDSRPDYKKREKKEKTEKRSSPSVVNEAFEATNEPSQLEHNVSGSDDRAFDNDVGDRYERSNDDIKLDEDVKDGGHKAEENIQEKQKDVTEYEDTYTNKESKFDKTETIM